MLHPGIPGLLEIAIFGKETKIKETVNEIP